MEKRGFFPDTYDIEAVEMNDVFMIPPLKESFTKYAVFGITRQLHLGDIDGVYGLGTV